MTKRANKALHLTAIPLRFIAAGELSVLGAYNWNNEKQHVKSRPISSVAKISRHRHAL